jgi:MFS family permease
MGKGSEGDRGGVDFSLSRHRPFAMFWLARVSTTVAFHIMGVSIGWQLYELTNNPLDLGLVGLMQFLPIIPLTLIVGPLADHFDRRRIIGICQVIVGLAVGLLLLGTAGGWLSRNAILAIVLIVGTARAFELPTMVALLPNLVPREAIPRAAAMWASANQTAQIVGPAIGGVLFAISPALAYTSSCLLFLMAGALVQMIEARPIERKPEPVSVASLFSGFKFIWSKPVILGSFSLDLFAVLFGGVLALLPVFARDILHTEAWGLGLLRSSPAIGALSMSIVLANFPLRGPIGHILFGAVALYGAASVLFGLSTTLALSMVALALVGMADVVSVVIRASIMQLQTPDELRGRVTAAFSMFTGTSNQLGEFRAGLVASIFGAVPAVVIGGLTTVAIAGLWTLVFPDLRRMRRMDR